MIRRRSSWPPREGSTAVVESPVRYLSVLVLMFLATIAHASPVPQIANPLVPVAVTPGGPAFTLTVNGTGFVSGSVVNWNGSPRGTTYISASQLTAVITAADIATPTTGSVTVVNPGGTPSLPALLTVRTAATNYWFGSAGFSPDLYSYQAGVLAGDFNGDGMPDIADNSGTQLQVLLGIGNGTFQPVTNYQASTTDAGLYTALGDFDNNGILDVALGGNQIDLFLGNSDGTFQPMKLESGAVGAAGDFNGDGKLDIAYGNFPSTVAVILGNGDGTFGLPTTFPVLQPVISGVAVADVNRDGIPDLIVLNALTGGGAGYVSVLIGRGDGTFAPHVDYPSGQYPFSPTMGDFNGDGYPDLAVVDGGSDDTVFVFMNKGDGTFLNPISYQSTSVPVEFNAMASADLNGDGFLDLVALNTYYCGDNCIEVFQGNGDGTFRSSVLYGIRQDTAGLTQGTLAFADFNRDGLLDIITQTSNGPYVMLQAQAPELTLESSRMTFGSQAVGTQSATKSQYFLPPNSTAINIGAISVTGDFQVAGCENTVLTYKCLEQVNFTPTATGNRTGVMTVNTDGGPQYVNLSGTGISSNLSVSVSPASLKFAPQILKTLSPYQNVTITNTGSGTVTFTSMSLTGSNPAEFALSNLCGSTLSAGASCTVQIGFAPNQRGVRSASLTISDNAVGSPQSVSLNGTGTALSLSPTSLNFGEVSVGSSSSQLLMISNVGGMNIFLQPLFVTGPASQDFAITHCGASLGARSTCEVTVTFTPSALGTRKAYLKFGNTGAGTPASTTVPLTGSGKQEKKRRAIFP